MKQIQIILAETIKKLYPDFGGEVSIERSKNKTFGDWSSAIALQLAKISGESPNVIAEKIVGSLPASELFKVSISAPGFINFTLTSAGWSMILKEISKTGGNWGKSHELENHKVLLEFISANPTGPLTLANGRGGFYGDALANAFAFLGAKVEREYYINDGGNQLKQLGLSVLASQKGETYEEGYNGEYVAELAKKLSADDPIEAGKEAAELIMKEWIKPAVGRMGIEFDHYQSEEALTENGTVDKVIALLEERKLMYKSEGAWWIKTTEFGDDKDRVAVRSDGTFTYFAKDIAYHWQKIERGYSDIITVVGADHYSEVMALQKIMDGVVQPKTEWTGKFSQPIVQFVRLVRKGKEVRMSKRAGNFVTLDELFDEVDIDVARFIFLTRELNTPLDFDLDIAKATSDLNPVYYVQYAFVRSKSVLDKAEYKPEGEQEIYTWEEKEIEVLHALYKWPELVRSVVDELAPHKLAHYAIELAKSYHQFYATCRILGEEPSVEAKRVALTEAVYMVLGQCLNVMGISRPEKMIKE